MTPPVFVIEESEHVGGQSQFGSDITFPNGYEVVPAISTQSQIGVLSPAPHFEPSVPFVYRMSSEQRSSMMLLQTAVPETAVHLYDRWLSIGSRRRNVTVNWNAADLHFFAVIIGFQNFRQFGSRVVDPVEKFDRHSRLLHSSFAREIPIERNDYALIFAFEIR